MAITFTNQGASADPDINISTDLSTYDSASWTPPSSGLLIAFIYSREAAGSNAVSSLVHDPTGANVAWTSIATVQYGASNVNRLSLYAIDSSTLGTGIDRVSYAGAQQCCSVSIFLAEGVDLSGGVAAAFVQSPTATDGGVAGTTGTVSLSAAGASANRPIAGFGHAAQEDTTFRTNWTEVDDLQGAAPVRGTETQVREDAFETTASATWTTSSRWGGIAAELLAETAEAGTAQMRSISALSGAGW